MNHCNLYYHMSLSKKKKKKTKNKNFYKYINVKQIENAFKYMTLILHYLFYIKLYTLKFFKWILKLYYNIVNYIKNRN